MSGDLPAIERGLGDSGEAVVLTGGGEAQDMASLLRLAPELAAPGHARSLAEAVNHLAQRGEFRVIQDPASFETWYREKLSKEDPETPWQEGVSRLCDFGVPDFSEIEPPVFTSGHLRFFAQDVFLGVPYRVDVPDLAAPPSYEPLKLTPVARVKPLATKPEFDPSALDDPPHIGPEEGEIS